MKDRYPRVEIDLGHLKHNVEAVVRKCGAMGIDIAGVIKGATGLPEVAKAFDEGGARWIASSRLAQIQDAIDAGITKPMMLIRIPMLSEVEDVVRLCDYSLESEVELLKAVNAEAARQGKIHNVILMADMGDLREGFWDKDEMAQVSLMIENDLKNLHLSGIGTNVGCYGSILPTVGKLNELVEVAEKIEAVIGRKLEIISGGATSSLLRVWDGTMPERINMLRCGEGILLARDLPLYYNCPQPELYQDMFRLKAEVIEVKDKPSHPVGDIGVDAFGHQVQYVDRGIRRRALLGMGKVDYGDPSELLPMEEGIEILGASSDHTIVDIEDAAKDWKVGDIMTFDVSYAVLVYITSSRNVNIVFK